MNIMPDEGAISYFEHPLVKEILSQNRIILEMNSKLIEYLYIPPMQYETSNIKSEN